MKITNLSIDDHKKKIYERLNFPYTIMKDLTVSFDNGYILTIKVLRQEAYLYLEVPVSYLFNELLKEADGFVNIEIRTCDISTKVRNRMKVNLIELSLKGSVIIKDVTNIYFCSVSQSDINWYPWNFSISTEDAFTSIEKEDGSRVTFTSDVEITLTKMEEK